VLLLLALAEVAAEVVLADVVAPVGAWIWPSVICVTGRPVTEVVGLLELVVAGLVEAVAPVGA
jgi:hypothetical protein